MKLSHWAKQQGISYLTAFRWFHSGKLPIKSQQMASGSILVYPESENNNIEERVFVYCRVSNQSRKEELKYQIKRCEDFCIANGWAITKTYHEIASGMNDNRKEFWKLIESNPTKIIVENKDRLTRFGFNYLERLLGKQGCKLIVINTSTTDEKDLLKDLVSIITSFCCRLYGMRRAKNKADKIKKILKQ
jgi:predicted site-specific integrase-resolvase